MSPATNSNLNPEEIKILIIDDVAGMRNQIRDLLKGFGFKKIAVCDDTIQATMMLKTEIYHLILCDWHLDTGNGFDLLKYVRSTPEIMNIGFIMVTAEKTRERVIDAINGGVDDYLIKPLTIQQIQNKVYGVLLKKGILQ